MKKFLKGEDSAKLSSSRSSSKVALGRVDPSSVARIGSFLKFSEDTSSIAFRVSWFKDGEEKTLTIKRQISAASSRLVAVNSAPKQDKNKCLSPALENAGTVFDSREIT